MGRFLPETSGLASVAKPKRMRRDKTMTVALWAEDVLVFSEADGRLDIAGTPGRLRSAERVLEAAAVELGYEARVGGGKSSSPVKPKRPGH